ncbi:MAG: PorP/SprF family type IX secretion system membrane protein [Bacteroidota bacterium]
MRRSLLITILSVSGLWVSGQDVPLFTQKLTNSFLYNPSVAGNSVGSLTLSHRQFWSGVQDSPTTNFFSFHTPFGNYKYGLGVNFYQDKIGVSQTLYGSAAFAYHVKITDNKAFSMGVSGEYNNQKINPVSADVIDADDDLLNQSGSVSNVDFSFGMSFRSKRFKIGGSANRLRSLVGIQDSSDHFPSFYSGFAGFAIPLANERDLLEPTVTLRSYASGSKQLDAGLFYTFNNTATLGGSYRTGGIVNLTAALKLYKYVTIGYSRDVYTGDYSKGLGATNEFTIRFDFRDESFYINKRNARSINTRALAVRRKTLSTYRAKGSPYQQSQRYKKSVKKNAYRSPNYRMDSSKKLQTMKLHKKQSNNRRRRR